MAGLSPNAGLTPVVRTPPPAGSAVRDHVTEEAAITASHGEELRVEMIADEDSVVPCGAPVARLRDAPDIFLVAPMAARVARISLRPGRRLTEIVLFRENGDVQGHDVADAAAGSAAALAALMQASGFWRRLRRRPFGRMPGPDETPAAIFVMAADTRPLAPDPHQALAGREDDLGRGLTALATLTGGPVFLCQPPGAPSVRTAVSGDRLRTLTAGTRHPNGLAGIRAHAAHPARIDAPVWDLHAEDAADLGALLATGVLPQTRLVSVAGPAMSETRSLRCQIGADLRELTYGATLPGPHRLLSGSALDGHAAHWLAPLHRQVTALPQDPAHNRPHWFIAALTSWSLPRPVIPTAALDQAAGAAFPVMAMVRALSVGDDETALKLGVLSLVEEDLALIDYVTGGRPRLSDLLRTMLDRIETEMAG